MKKLSLSLFFITMLSIFVLAGCQSASAPSAEVPVVAPSAPEVSEEVLKIGYITPLTGEVASIGEDMKNTTDMFVAENPIWAGKKVQIIAEDGRCDPSTGVNAANKLINNDKVKVLFTDDCSGVSLAVAPIANQNKVLLMTSLSTSPDFTSGGGDFGFRNAPSDETSSDVIVGYMLGKYKNIALISENTDFSQAYRKKISEKASKNGLKVVVDETFNTGTTDFKTTLTKIKSAKPDVIVNLSNGGTSAGLVSKQRVELGINIPELGTDVMTSKEFFDTAKNASDGMVIAVTALDDSNTTVKAFLAKYTAKYGKAPSSPAYAALAYDKMDLMKDAIEKVGYDSEKLRDYLYAMPAFGGLAGSTKFDSTGDSSILPNLMVAKDGKFQILKK